MAMRRAFTLVEALFALAIAAMVMTGACFLMFEMVSILSRFEEREPFEVHVNGVEMFLKNVLKKSRFLDSRDYSVSFTAFAENKNLGKGNPPDSMMGDKSRLFFGVLDDVPFFISRRGFSPEKDAWLDFREKEGLFIIWTFAKNENYNAASDDRPIYESLVSPYVTSLSYVYIDEDGRWIEEDDMDSVSSSSIASNQMPNFIKLVFEKGGETHVRYVSLISNVDSQYEPDGESSSSRRSSASGGEGGEGGEGGRGGRGADGRGGIAPSGGEGGRGGNPPAGGRGGEGRGSNPAAGGGNSGSRGGSAAGGNPGSRGGARGGNPGAGGRSLRGEGGAGR